MTVRQNAAPVSFNMTRRPDNTSTLTSVRAGVCNVISYAPVLRGESATGRMNAMLQLAEMPKPVNNAIIARVQAWFVPRPALPQFSGLDEYTHAYHGTNITQLGAAARTPPSLFATMAGSTADASEIYQTLGIQTVAGENVNTDLFDAYAVVQNFRLAAHSTKLTRYNYVGEGGVAPYVATALKPAFWPTGRMHQMVPDYESALVTGSLDLDVSAGRVDVRFEAGGASDPFAILSEGGNRFQINTSGPAAILGVAAGTARDLFGDLTGQTITTTLADIDKARTTNAFAKMMASYAGTNFSGFNNDDVIVSELMQGFMVPQELLNRPMLLDNKTVIFGQTERHASGSLADLDDSVTTGQASVSLSLNIPKAEYGGIMICTLEIMPERLYERQSDEYCYVTSVDDLPNALRDVQRVEPVDQVMLRRWDVRHSTPSALAAFEPMNAKWRREFTRLGGEFLQTTPGTPVTTARTAIWQPDVVDPSMNTDFWLCPYPFPHDVFSVPSADCCEVALVQQLTITGITQFGDQLVEDNGEFLTVSSEE